MGQARHAHLGGVQFVEDDYKGLSVEEETIELEESVLEVDTLCASTTKRINCRNFYMKVEIQSIVYDICSLRDQVRLVVTFSSSLSRLTGAFSH